MENHIEHLDREMCRSLAVRRVPSGCMHLQAECERRAREVAQEAMDASG